MPETIDVILTDTSTADDLIDVILVDAATATATVGSGIEIDVIIDGDQTLTSTVTDDLLLDVIVEQSVDSTSVVTPEALIDVLLEGAPGPPGPAGPPGGTITPFLFPQSNPSNQWHIVHGYNLPYRPSVVVEKTGGGVIVPGVLYPDNNTVDLYFGQLESGTATLNF